MSWKRKEGDTGSKQNPKTGKFYLKKILYVLIYGIAGCIAAAVLSVMFLPVLQVSGNGMEPTLQKEDIILLMKKNDFQPGDVVGIQQDGKILLKRIIAKGQDQVNIDENGNVYVNGDLLNEPYLQEKSLGNCEIKFPFIVEEGSYFVLGDNREESTDSRNTILGSVYGENIIGKVLVILWPFEHITFVD